MANDRLIQMQARLTPAGAKVLPLNMAHLQSAIELAQ